MYKTETKGLMAVWYLCKTVIIQHKVKQTNNSYTDQFVNTLTYLADTLDYMVVFVFVILHVLRTYLSIVSMKLSLFLLYPTFTASGWIVSLVMVFPFIYGYLCVYDFHVLTVNYIN